MLANTPETTKKSKFKFPHVLVLLFAVIIVAAIFTYIATPGEYDRVEVEGRTVVDPGSYQVVERNPVGPFGVLQAIPKGLGEVQLIVFFIFIVGGAFGIINKTGAIHRGINSLTKTLKGKEQLIIPVMMLVFALGAGLLGLIEEFLPFIPIMVLLCLALGFDSLTGAGIVLIGAGAGFAGAFMNPFTVGVAQGIAELPLFSGLGYRIIVWLVITLIGIAFVYLHANRVKKNPKLSPVYEEDLKKKETMANNNNEEAKGVEGKHKAVLVVVLVFFGLLAWGVISEGWYILEIAALFLGMGIVAGIVGRLSANDIADGFVIGAKELTMAALIVGIARAILVVLEEGFIIDTVLFGMSNALQGFPAYLSAAGMYFFQILLNIIVPSGSGQAALTMPIMAPLSDLVGVTRQTAVIAYQLGDGFTNVWSPTSGFFMAGLGLAGVMWDKWAKWFLPCLGIWILAGIILVSIAQIINLGPF